MSVGERSGHFKSRLPQGLRWLSRHRHDLALGIEKIGLVSLRHPTIVGILAAMLTIAAAFGVSRIWRVM
jgi:hypothetical protein